MSSVSAQRRRFAALHAEGFFVIPNPFDLGSARLLEAAGAVAVATTSSGLAATLGRADGHLTRDELATHVRALTEALDIPVHVDAEICYPRDEGGVTRTVALLAEAGASGVSIEDFDPVPDQVVPLDEARARVAEVAAEAHRHDILVAARAENFLHDRPDLDDTLERLAAYRDAGADMLYAPGLSAEEDIAQVVGLGLPVNVLATAATPPTARLCELGVRRVSTGGALTWAAYGAFLRGATELFEDGTTGYLADALTAQQRQAFRDA